MKVATIMLVIVVMFCVLLARPALAQNRMILDVSNLEGEARCDAIQDNLKIRADYYELNAASILSAFERNFVSLQSAEEIFNQIGYDTTELSQNLVRYERYLRDIESLTTLILSQFEEAQSLVCENERSFRVAIIDITQSLKDLRQEIQNVQTFLSIRVSNSIQMIRQ